MAGKGDKPRPVDQQKFAANWDRIWGPKKAGKGKYHG